MKDDENEQQLGDISSNLTGLLENGKSLKKYAIVGIISLILHL